MKSQEDFDELLKEFHYIVKEFESHLLSWESLRLAQKEQALSGRYPEEAVRNAGECLRDGISTYGEDLANIALQLSNACAFYSGS